MRSGKFGCRRGDLGHDALGHLVAQAVLRLPVGRDRQIEGEAAGRVHTLGSQARVVQRGDLEVEGGRLWHQAAHAALEVGLHLLGRAEERDVAAERGAVELLVGAAVLGQSRQREVGLEVGGTVVDRRHPASERVRQGLGIDQIDEGRGGIEVRHDDGCRHDGSIAELDAADRAPVDDDLA